MQSVSRLVQTFVPDHYNLSLTLQRHERRFSGTITVNGVVVGSDTIRLHQKVLAVQSATVDGKEASFTLTDDEVVISHPDIAVGKAIEAAKAAGLDEETLAQMLKESPLGKSMAPAAPN